jgi:hypothetical protein
VTARESDETRGLPLLPLEGPTGNAEAGEPVRQIVVVSVNGSDGAWTALTRALTKAAHGGASVEVVHAARYAASEVLAGQRRRGGACANQGPLSS